jgi:hypothetical protein
MFEFLKRRKQPKEVVLSPAERLCELYKELSADIAEKYQEFPEVRPAEIHLFAISATSIYAQNLGGLCSEEIQALIDEFVDLSITNMHRYMPQSDQALIQIAMSRRFDEYTDVIVDAFNHSSSTDSFQEAGRALVATMDQNFGIERGAFLQTLAGGMFSLDLTKHAYAVRDAISQ